MLALASSRRGHFKGPGRTVLAAASGWPLLVCARELPSQSLSGTVNRPSIHGKEKVYGSIP